MTTPVSEPRPAAAQAATTCCEPGELATCCQDSAKSDCCGAASASEAVQAAPSSCGCR
ncbi:hypothetical protein [Actinocorallia populi]|uniref:hypothetical protein n=1 Tax=Actinocorallia populi TaxID=2079200 RepID=UPI0013002A5A|nr:hypothetical protein [Actinocorallia populi]